MESYFTCNECGEIQTNLKGINLLRFPLLNKGTAFTEEERKQFHLRGLLPPHIKTIEDQAAHIYAEYHKYTSDLSKHIFLRSLQDRNTTLFYYVLSKHIEEMMPIIYTPVVGEACQKFGHIFRQSHGIYISYPDREHMEEILNNALTQNVRVIVVTDGERILGLGDQGVGGMGIPIGKLALYTLCGGIDPLTTLPIFLDVGTNNKELLEDSTYLGWPRERIPEGEYEAFIEQFITTIDKIFPGTLLQFEDFAQPHAYKFLERYRNRLCCFNDDIQGTAAVALSAALAATAVSKTKLKDQTVVIFGAGSAGCGIATQLACAMQREGLSAQEARERFYLIDREGLLIDGMPMQPFQKPFAKARSALEKWPCGREKNISLASVITYGRPTMLLGVSGQPGTFTQELIKEMARHTDRPIIFPLSNPTSRAEATPADLIKWTDGRALIATGSPFPPVEYKGETYDTAQCNNCYIFPGMGLGIIASGAKRVTDEMFMAAAITLSEQAPAMHTAGGALLPQLSTIQEVSQKVALAVALEAQKQGLAPAICPEATQDAIQKSFWHPRYRTFC